MNHAPITSPASDDDFVRLPGLFDPGVDFHLEEAGEASDGTPLFAVYRRERTQTSSETPNPKKEQ
jgi:hypothetical protein